MQRIFLLVAVVILLVAAPAAAQTDSTMFRDAESLLTEGIQAYDTGNYQAALRCFKQVSLASPAYARACFEIALCYSSMDSLNLALAKSEEAFDLEPEDVDFIILRASILDDAKKTDDAIKLLQEAKKHWPFNRRVLFNLAVCYMNATRYPEAEQCLLQTCKYHPYIASNHLALAKVNYYMGRYAQAYMAFQMAIAVSPSVAYLQEYQDFITGKKDVYVKSYRFPYPSGVDHAKWDNLSKLWNTDLAFRKDFDLKHPINLAVSQHIYMVLQTVTYDPADTSLYNQFYARYLQNIYQNGKADEYIYYLFQTTTVDGVEAWKRKNPQASDQFVQWTLSLLDSWKQYGFNSVNEQNQTKVMHYENNVLQSLGTLREVGQAIKTGNWINISPTGYIEEKGAFENDLRQGEWLVFWPNGKIKQQLNFVNDKLSGSNFTFHPNGTKDGNYMFENGEKSGKEERFMPSGRLASYTNYKAGLAHDKNFSNNFAELFSVETMAVDNKMIGPVKHKWLNGNTKLVGVMNDTVYVGEVLRYHPNGNLESKEQYSNGYVNGIQQYYHPNGAKHVEYACDSLGQIHGVRKEYYSNGKLFSEDNTYTHGKLNGTQSIYFPNGKLRQISGYKDDNIQWIENYDTTGKSLGKIETLNGILNYKSYHYNGVLEVEGVYKNHKREGEWRYYTPSGNLKMLQNFTDGLLNGEAKKYYANGNLEEVVTYDSSLMHGEYRYYYENGKLQSKSYYQNGELTGEAVSYYQNDSLKSLGSYAGHIVGRFIAKKPDGKLQNEEFYNVEGTSERLIEYDRNQAKLLDIRYAYDSVTVEAKEADGITKYKVNIVDNLRHGPYKAYYPDGKPRVLSNYLHGQLNGPYSYYNSSGQVEFESNFCMGKHHGTIKRYKLGKLWTEDQMVQDVSQGKSSTYYTNGKLERVNYSIDDAREGFDVRYAPDGTWMYKQYMYHNQVVSYTYRNATGQTITTSVNQLKNSPLVAYYPSGKVAATIPMVNGMYNGKHQLFNTDGKLLYEAEYKKDMAEGVMKSYYENGLLKEEVTKVADERHGPYKYYYPSGKLYEAGSFYWGTEDGEWKYYDATGKLSYSLFYDKGDVYKKVTY